MACSLCPCLCLTHLFLFADVNFLEHSFGDSVTYITNRNYLCENWVHLYVVVKAFLWLWLCCYTFKEHFGRPKWALSRHALQWTNVTALSKGPSPLELHRSHFWTKQQLWPYIALCPFHFILGKDFTFCTAKKYLLTNISPSHRLTQK